MKNWGGYVPQNEKAWSSYEDRSGKTNDMQWPSGTFTSIMTMHQIMSFYFPDVVHERLMARIKEKLGGKWGNTELMSVEERRKKVADMMLDRTVLEKKINELKDEIAAINSALHL